MAMAWEASYLQSDMLGKRTAVTASSAAQPELLAVSWLSETCLAENWYIGSSAHPETARVYAAVLIVIPAPPLPWEAGGLLYYYLNVCVYSALYITPQHAR